MNHFITPGSYSRSRSLSIFAAAADGGHGTSGTRWFKGWMTDTGAGTSIRWFKLPFDCVFELMQYSNRSVGSGTGTYDVTLCTINFADDAVTTTALTLNVDADVTREAEIETDVTLSKGTYVGVRSVANGTISASPTSPQVGFRVRAL